MDFLITKNGFKKLKSELFYLKDIERPNIIEAISTARDLGDLKENAEYHSAKDRQGMIEAKISDLTNKLSRASIIDVNDSSQSCDKISFGLSVELKNLNNGNIVNYRIVSDYESDIDQGFISDKSPFARALIGKRLDEEVEVKTPSGVKEFKITKIEI
jgi:transcription elongation factor GreA